MDSDLPLIIVNPASRGGAGARDWPSAAATIRAHFGPFERRFTEASGHASVLAREEAERGRRLLLTFGGDGTISETARGILDSGAACELGVLPHGTGGDFVRSLSTPARLADAARGLRLGRTTSIDVGRVTFSEGESRSFVNSASFGLSAEVVHRVNQSSKSKGSYASQTLRAALSFEHPNVELSVDGRPPRRVAITTVSIHNGRFFGGGMKMAPKAELTDGKLAIVVVKKMPPLKLLSRAPLLYWGAHVAIAEVEQGSLESLLAQPVDPAREIRLEIDGESVGRLPARFTIEPAALRVRMPATQD